MRLNQLISAILLSTTALTAAAVDVSTEAQMYVVEFKDGTESGYALMLGEQALGTVFHSTVVRTERDYTICKTDNPLSHAFVPSSESVLLQWFNGAEFLLETLWAGLEYSRSLKEDHPPEEVPTMRAVNPEFLKELFDKVIIINKCLQYGEYSFLSESLLNCLYLDIMGSIDEIRQDGPLFLQHLVHTMYVPIRDWMKENFPVCPMYDYVRPQVTIVPGQQTRVDYFFEAERYFYGYLYQSEAYKRIRAFAESKPLLQNDFGISLNGFVKSTVIELGEGQPGDDSLMQYARFLEGIKQREIVFVETWMSKLHEDQARLADRAAEIKKQAAEQKAGKARDPQAVLEEMMRAMGLVEPKTAQLKRAKTMPPKKPAQLNPSVTAKGTHHLLKETAPVAMAAAAAAENRIISEKERLANLAETEAKNAAHNRKQGDRQENLEMRRAEMAENEARVRRALRARQESWLESAFSARLASFDPSQQISLGELNLASDFDTVCGRLIRSGCYLDLNIHGNEKGIARWIGSDGKKVMVWFDRPHGAQLKMGVAAGWFKSLIKRLRETGKLVS